MEKKPLFIVFEGLDGSGKGTQIALLKQRLKAAGRSVSVTAEPTESATGGLIRDALSNLYHREPAELAGMFLADRIAHNVNPVWGIKKSLADGKDVISDRYYYSSFAYQGMETDINWLLGANLGCPEIEKPDLCIFLDVPPENCISRIDSDRSHKEIFEDSAATLDTVRGKFFAAFELLKDRENIKIVAANRQPQVIADEIFAIVEKLL